MGTTVSSPRTVELRYGVVIPEPKDKGDPIRVWLPLPASTPQQELLGIQTQGTLAVEMHYDPIFGNAILHAFTDGSGGGKSHIEYRAIVRRREWRVDLA